MIQESPPELGRDQFRESVFSRDNHRCVKCGEVAADAHHIIERRLWPSGGYFLDNGASLCQKHHLLAETTILTVEEIREACGITRNWVPPHLYPDQKYDKWGNPILPNGRRLMGELFWDESVQKALREGEVLGDFTHWVKYPRTHHLAWSPGATDDDRFMNSDEHLKGERVIVTEKKDGECTTLYSDYIHARSVDSRNHPSRNWVKNFWSQIKQDIPTHWRICGENLFAKHSIAYDSLPSYFMGFSMWDDKNICRPWDETVEWFELLGISPVTVLFDGIYDEKVLKDIAENLDTTKQEGYVVRHAGAFSYRDFKSRVGKYVRKGHVQTVKHWMHGQAIQPNRLSS